MTVMVTDNEKKFYGSSTPGPFTWTWRFLANSDIIVSRITGGVRSILAEGDDYTLSGAGSFSGGTLTLTSNLVVGEELIITRYTEALQPVSIRNQGNNFRPEIHEDIFDRQTMMIQDRASKVQRTILLPEGEVSETIDATEYSNRAGMVLGWDSLGRLALKAMNIITSSGLFSNPWADVRGYASINAAVGALGGTAIQLRIFGTVALTSDLTIPANIELKPMNGGLIDTNGHVLNIAGPLSAGAFPVFTGNGSVIGLKEAIPEWWGGSTSASAATNKSAIRSALSSGAKRIIFGGGIYTVASDPVTIFTISSNMDIEFINSSAIKVQTTTASHRVFNLTNAVTLCRLHNMAVDLNYGGTVYSPQAIVIDGAQNITINNPIVFNSAVVRAWPNTGWGYGIYLNGADWGNVVINNPQIFDIMYAIITEPSSTGSILKIRGGYIYCCSGDGVEINVPTGSCSDILVDGTAFYLIGDGTTARGLGVGASGAAGPAISNMKLINATFLECGYHGIHIEEGNRDVIIDNCFFWRCGGLNGSNYGAAIYMAVTNVTRLSTNVRINNCNIIGSSVTAYAVYGIYAGGLQTFKGVKISNTFVDRIAVGGAAGVGIFIGSAHTDTEVVDNTVKNTNGYGVVFAPLSGKLTDNTLYDDQGVPTQTYGASLINYAATNGFTVRDNHMYGNINKGYYVGTAGNLHPFVIEKDHGEAKYLPANNGFTALTDFINLGYSASGTIYIKYSRPNHYAAALYSFTWNGVTLTATLIRKTASGSLALTDAATGFSMNGTWLQSKVYWSGGAVADIDAEMVITGMILLK